MGGWEEEGERGHCDTMQCDGARQFKGSRAVILSALEVTFPSASDCLGDVGEGD